MRLIITRHGETEENKAGILMGHLPGKLNELGIEQAKKVALRLKDEKIDFVYSSDLDRSAKTAKEIAKYHKHIELKLTPELRERNMGEYQGKKNSEVNWTKTENPEGSETWDEVYDRAKKFIHKVLHAHPKDTVLIVAHNGINKALLANITGKNVKEMRSMEHHHNTSVNILDLSEDKSHKLHVFNCIKHLQA